MTRRKHLRLHRRWERPKLLRGTIFFAVTACFGTAHAQTPVIQKNGIVSAASWGSPVSPGQLISIFGTNLSASTVTATAPFPLSIDGVSVTIDGIAAPLAFISPGQINAQAPVSLASRNSVVTNVNVVVTTRAGLSSPETAAITDAYPGLFSSDGSGCGRAAALNVTPYAASVNTPANSAAPGDFIALFGTGFGSAMTQSAAGAAAAASPLAVTPSVYIDEKRAPNVVYAGLAPTLAGVDQINVQIPAGTRNGCSVPVSVSQTFASPLLTISVSDTRGQCADPPIRSYGQVSFARAEYFGPGSEPATVSDFFSATFPSAPALEYPAPEMPVFAPAFRTAPASAVTPVLIEAQGPVHLNIRACPVSGYSKLSAGSISLRSPAGGTNISDPQPLLTDGVYYALPLPDGYIRKGTYTFSGSEGSAVSLKSALDIGSPIQVENSFPPGTAISAKQPLTVRWTGGDAGTLVRVSLFSGGGSTYDYSYADASAGTLTFTPGLSLPLPADARLVVEVAPAPERLKEITVPGVTGPVQLRWRYTYTYSGLRLVE